MLPRAGGRAVTDRVAQGPYYFPMHKWKRKSFIRTVPIQARCVGSECPQAHFALESCLDMLAERLGMDPFDICARGTCSNPEMLSIHRVVMV
jgi:CO/xanthine dehydrogenase Mo-binding subunit